jgi:hypothetical protein
LRSSQLGCPRSIAAVTARMSGDRSRQVPLRRFAVLYCITGPM